MSVIGANQIWEGRDGSDGDDGVRNYTQIWRVQTNNKYDDAVTVLTAGGYGIPYRGLLHPSDPFAYCRTVRARNEGASPYWWTVTAIYSTEREINDSPLDDPAEITWSGEQFQEVVVFDNANNAILNSAGDLFDPPPMRDRTRRTCDIRFNLAVVPTWILDYEDSINNAAIIIDGLPVAAKTAKCGIVNVSSVKERNDISYREVSVTLHLNSDAWALSVLDQGFREKDATDPAQRNNISNDGDNAEPTVPVLLDGNGEALDDPNLLNAVFLEFDVYSEKDFTVIPGIIAG